MNFYNDKTIYKLLFILLCIFGVLLMIIAILSKGWVYGLYFSLGYIFFIAIITLKAKQIYDFYWDYDSNNLKLFEFIETKLWAKHAILGFILLIILITWLIFFPR